MYLWENMGKNFMQIDTKKIEYFATEFRRVIDRVKDEDKFRED